MSKQLKLKDWTKGQKYKWTKNEKIDKNTMINELTSERQNERIKETRTKAQMNENTDKP